MANDKKQPEDKSEQDFQEGYSGKEKAPEKSVVDVVKDKVSDAYDWQREKRAEHPIADFALNFIPVVGTAAAADDVSNDIKKEDYKAAIIDAVGLMPAGKLLSKGTDVVMAADNAIRRSLVAKGYAASDVNDASTAFLSATGLSATTGAAVKTKDVVDDESKNAEEDFKKGYEGKSKSDSKNNK